MQKLDILFWERGREFSVKLKETLSAARYPTHIIKHVRELRRVLKQLDEPVLVVDIAREQDGSDRIRSLIQGEDLHRLPVVIIGTHALSYEVTLKEYFSVVGCFETPCDFEKLLAFLATLATPLQVGPDSGDHPEVSGEVVPDSGAGHPRADEDAKARDLTQIHELYGSFESFPDLIFNQLTLLNLVSTSLDGHLYVQAIDSRPISEIPYLPQESSSQDLLTNTFAKYGRWSSGHVHRVTFLVYKILSALGLSGEKMEEAKLSSVLFLSSFTSGPYQGDSQVRKNVLRLKSRAHRQELCSKIKDSALMITGELGLKSIGNITAIVGKMAGGEEVVTDETTSQIASAILIADWIDRACWQKGIWDPAAGHFVMQRFKRGEFTFIHPLVLCCLVKILAEAMAATDPLFLLPKKLAKNPELRDKARKNREQVAGPNETKIPIPQLVPGMRLARPLYSFDGRRILDADLVLDQDLIWRLWQLSTVRPLNSPLIVTSEM